MNDLQILIDNYLEYCKNQKRLDTKTIKAYRIDLSQFSKQNIAPNASAITSDMLENYVATLHQKFKPKTVKRKIASLKAFFHYLEYKEITIINPFNKIKLHFREPVILPKTIPLHTIETFLSAIYNQYHNAKNHLPKRLCTKRCSRYRITFCYRNENFRTMLLKNQ